jgi:hypothetical protein
MLQSKLLAKVTVGNHRVAPSTSMSIYGHNFVHVAGLTRRKNNCDMHFIISKGKQFPG